MLTLGSCDLNETDLLMIIDTSHDFLVHLLLINTSKHITKVGFITLLHS